MKVEASPAEDNPPENLPPQVNSEPEPEPEDGPDPSSGKIPFKTMTLTWGTLCAGIKETIKPDVPSAIVTGNAIYLVLLLATTICKNWSLAVSGHCGETFQSVSAAGCWTRTAHSQLLSANVSLVVTDPGSAARRSSTLLRSACPYSTRSGCSSFSRNLIQTRSNLHILCRP